MKKCLLCGCSAEGVVDVCWNCYNEQAGKVGELEGRIETLEAEKAAKGQTIASLRSQLGEVAETEWDLKRLDPIPAGDNPFVFDIYNMGSQLGTNVVVMYGKHPNERQRYLIIVDMETGKRLRINLQRKESQ